MCREMRTGWNLPVPEAPRRPGPLCHESRESLLYVVVFPDLHARISVLAVSVCAGVTGYAGGRALNMITKRIVRFPSLQGPGSFSFDRVCQALGSSAKCCRIQSCQDGMAFVRADEALHRSLCKPCDFSCRSSCRFGYEFLRWQFHDDEAPSFQDTETASAS